MKKYKHFSITVLFLLLPFYPIQGIAEFQQVIGPKVFTFPQDHGAHPDFRSEWWYLTANLHDEVGNDYGVQFTLFRLGATPNHSLPDSWIIHQSYMAHAALSKPLSNQFLFEQRFSRDSFGLAGVSVNPFRAWLHDWELHANTDSDLSHLTLNMSLKAHDVQLDFRQSKPIVLQGQAGYSRKSIEPGNASYYYSIPRFQVSGTIQHEEKRVKVTGQGWLDREWSTSFLGESQSGWDWFALKFNTNEELMIYKMRRIDGKTDPHNYAVWINKDGTKKIIAFSSLIILNKNFWQSNQSHRYVTQWEIEIPEKELKINVNAIMPNQLVNGAIPYWEGAVKVTGSHQGFGFVEQFKQQPSTQSFMKFKP